MNSESIKELATALVQAQAEMPAAPMNAVNPFLKNKYADLGAVIQTSRPVLAKYGLAVSQTVYGEAGSVGVNTMLMHKSGEWISNSICMEIGEEKGKSAAQVAGSIITYLRRYSLASILGMYADEDTDGNHPQQSSRPAAQPNQQQPFAPADETMTLEEAENILNSKGVRYGDMPTDQLEWVANSDKTPERKKVAAKLILSLKRA